MFESLVANLINNYLGDFVENLNTSQLKIGLWTGDIMLNNLTIKENALADWDLPVKIQVGRIGKLLINIPWKNPYTEPTVAEVSDVYVLAVPSVNISYNSEKEEWAKQEAKQQKLALIEDAQNLAAEKGFNREKFVEKLCSHVAKNLQLKVRNVHLRYEDNVTNPTRPFALGVCLKELLFQTADEHWEPCVTKKVVAEMFKLVRVYHLSMYWNSRSPLSVGMKQEDILTDLKEKLNIASNRKDIKPQLNYIVKPIFIVAHLKLNARPEQNNFTIPKVGIIAVFDEIAFCLSKDQYDDMQELIESVERLRKLKLFRKYHPNVPLRGNCRTWWQHAYYSILIEIVQRRRRMWSWSHIMEHRRILKHYRNAYIQKLMSDPVPANVLSVLTKGEAYLDVFNILFMRQQAELHVTKLKGKQAAGKSSTTSISGLFAMGEIETETRTAGVRVSGANFNKAGEFSSAVKYDSPSVSGDLEQTQTDVSLPVDYEVVKILIKLKNVSVFLWDEKHATKTKIAWYNACQVIKLQLEDTYCSFRQSSAANAFILEAKVDSLVVKGVPQRGIMPKVVTSQPTEREQVYSLLTLAVECNPLDTSCDTSFKMKTRPLQITYDAKTASTLHEFFTPPVSVRQSQQSNLKLARFTALTKSGTNYVIDQHKHTDIYVNMMSSYIILPENGFLKHCSRVLVLDLGQLLVISRKQRASVSKTACEREPHSIPQPSTSSMPQKDINNTENSAYEKFNITLSRIQLLFARPGEQWLLARDAAQSALHVLQPISILLDVSVCILGKNPRMPAVRVSGVLPSLTLSVSDFRLGEIVNLLWSIPLSETMPSQKVDSDSPSFKRTNGLGAMPQKQTTQRKYDAAERGTVLVENINFTDAELLFEIKEIVISIYVEESESVKLCMKLIVESIGCCVKVKTFDMVADAYISNVVLQYLDHAMSDTLSTQLKNVKAAGGPVITLVHTPAFKKVLTVRYLQAQKNNPQFSTVYDNIKTKLNISVSQLDLLLHFEALNTLMTLAGMLSPSPKGQQPREKSFASLLEARYIIHLSRLDSKQKGKTREQSDSGIIDIKIEAALHQLSAGVCNDSTLFIYAHSKDTSLTIEMGKQQTTILTALKEMMILDPDPKTLYQTIVQVKERDAFKATVVLFTEASRNENALDLSCVDYAFNTNTRSVKVVYVTKFINTIFYCWDEFQRIVFDVPGNNDTTCAADEDASRIGLNIQAENVVVMLPANHSLSSRCFILDLHAMTITNTFKACNVRSSSGSFAVLDLMEVITSSLEVSVGALEKDGGEISKCSLSEPQPMSLIVQRNLSAQWYHKEPDLKVTGTLGHFAIRLNGCDYDTFWQAVNELLYEDTDSSKPESEPTKYSASPEAFNKAINSLDTDGSDYFAEANIQLQPTWLNVAVQFQRVTICFYNGDSFLQPGSKSYSAQKALFKFDIIEMSVDHSSFRDGAILSNVSMMNLIVDDMRTEKQSGITRMIERSTMCEKRSVLFAIKYAQNAQLDTTMRLLFRDMCFCACLDFLTVVWNFIASNEQNDSSSGTVDALDVTNKSASSPKTQSSAQNQGFFDIHVDIDVPEVVFIEDRDKKTSNVFVVHMRMSFQMLQTVDEQTMEARVSDLQMFFSTFDQRSSYQLEVMPFCNVNLHCKTRYGESTSADAQIDALDLHLSPFIIRSLSTVCQDFYQLSNHRSEASSLASGDDFDNDGPLWEEKPIVDCHLWFLKRAEGNSIDQTTDFVKTSPPSEERNEPLEETLCLKMPMFVIRLDGYVGHRIVPLLIAGCSVAAQIKDWNSQLSIDGDLELDVSYYNESLAVWEPLIEPIIGERETHRWKISFDVQINEDKSCVPSEERTLESDEQVVVQPSKMVISVRSSDVLQVCLTVTCIDILTGLSKAFGGIDVMTPNTQIGEVKQWPYLFQNHTECGMLLQLGAAFQSPAPGFIKLGAGVALSVENNQKVRPHTANKGHYGFVTQLAVEHKIMFQVGTFNVKSKATIKRVEKRLFPVGNRTQYGDWFIVCNTDCSLGQKIVTFHSVVRIKNELQFSVEVHVMTSRAPNVCGVAQPEQFFSLPLNAVYAHLPELFFKPERGSYLCQAVAFNWNTSLNGTVHQVCCRSTERGHSPCHFSIFFEIEHICFQSNEECTEKCYLLVLQPSVVLHNRLPCSMRYKEHTFLQGDRLLLTDVSGYEATLQITIPAYAEFTWVGELTLQRNMPELTMLEFTAIKDGSRDVLELGVYTKFQKGSLDVSLYSPYWLINKTARTLCYRGPHHQKPVVHPAHKKRIVLFSYMDRSALKGVKRKPDNSKKKQAQLQVDNSEWSEKFSLDTVGSNGTVRCSRKSKDRPGADVGVSIELSTFGLTKLVTFTPYYLLLNTADVGVMVTEDGGIEWMQVGRGECLPFWPLFLSKNIKLQAKFTGTEEVTDYFFINQSHTTLLRLDNQFGGIGTECIVSDLSIVTTFRTYSPGLATAHIVNHTDKFTVTVWQTCEQDKNKTEVRKRCAVLYTWDNALGKRELAWSCGKKKNVKTDLSDGMEEFFASRGTKVYCMSFLDGPQRILLFTEDMSVALNSQLLLNPSSVMEFKQMEQEINLQLQGFGLSLVNDRTQKEVAFLSITSSNIVWEQQRKNHYRPLEENASQLLEAAWQKFHDDLADGKNPSTSLSLGNNMELDVLEQTLTVSAPQLSYPGFSGSLISRKLDMTGFRSQTIPIRRCFENGIWMQYKTSSHYMQLHVKINCLQLDNQLSHAVFPIVLCPVPPPKSVATDRKLKTFIEVSLTLKRHEHSNINQINYFKVLIQEMKVQIDQGFLLAILEMFSVNKPVQREKEISLFKEDMDRIEKSLIEVIDMTISQGNKNIYDYVHFSPIKIHVSFSLHTGEGTSSELMDSFVGVFLKSVGVVLTDIEDVVFKLGYFERSRLLCSQTLLIKDLSRHYASQAIKQMYVLVLGLKVLGNPFGLLRGLSEGIEDLFYEPYYGAIQGPKEFAEGLALGVRSLLGKTVGGAVNAVSRITGTLGQGLATLTLDDNYQKKRREVLSKPVSSAKQGFAKGGKGLVIGVLDGVSGIVSQPVEGALKQGVGGFVKGVGKGLLGAVTQPTAGVVDFASGSLEGIRRLAGVSEKTTRFRSSRRFFKDRIIRPYDPKGAAGHFILEATDRGRYVATDDYQTHVVLENHVLLVTNNRVLMLKHDHLFDTWDTVWTHEWDELHGFPNVTTGGIEFVLRQEERKFLLFKASNKKEIVLPDPDLSELIVDTIRQQMKGSSQRSKSIF